MNSEHHTHERQKDFRLRDYIPLIVILGLTLLASVAKQADYWLKITQFLKDNNPNPSPFERSIQLIKRW